MNNTEDKKITMNDIKDKKIDNEDKNTEDKKTDDKNKKYTGDLRGFKTYKEAVNYPFTKEFSKLDKGCQEEYKNWLKTIK